MSGPTTGISAWRIFPTSAASMSKWIDLRAGCERGHLAGDAVVEPRADGDHEVGLVESPVRELRARACRARRSSAGGSPGRQPLPISVTTAGSRAASTSASSSAQASALSTPPPAYTIGRSAAAIASRRLADLPRVNLARRLPAGQVDVVRVLEVELRLLHVLRDVDEHRALAPGARDVERRLQDAGSSSTSWTSQECLTIGIVMPVRRSPGRRRCRSAFERTWPVMKTSGVESIHASAIGVTRFVAPGPGRRDRDSDLSGGARVALGHVACALLVAGQHVPHGRAPRDRVVGRAGSRRPGIPKATSTPSSSSARRIASEPEHPGPASLNATPRRSARGRSATAAAARSRRR